MSTRASKMQQAASSRQIGGDSSVQVQYIINKTSNSSIGKGLIYWIIDTIDEVIQIAKVKRSWEEE